MWPTAFHQMDTRQTPPANCASLCSPLFSPHDGDVTKPYAPQPSRHLSSKASFHDALFSHHPAVPSQPCLPCLLVPHKSAGFCTWPCAFSRSIALVFLCFLPHTVFCLLLLLVEQCFAVYWYFFPTRASGHKWFRLLRCRIWLVYSRESGDKMG